MKNLAFIALLMSMGAQACPELAAQYSKCDSYTNNLPDTHNMVITQNTVEGVTSYKISQVSDEDSQYSELELVADGKEYQVNEEEGIVTKIKTECTGNSVRYLKTLSYGDRVFAYRIYVYEQKYRQLEIKFEIGNTRVGTPTRDLIVCR